MKTQHTPGPWNIVRASEFTGDPEDNAIQSITANDGTTILFTDSGYFKPSEFNARLIASAPQLLEALEDIIRDFTVIECTRCDGTGKRLTRPDEACHVCAGAGEIVPQQAWPQFVKNARTAIANAKGQTL